MRIVQEKTGFGGVAASLVISQAPPSAGVSRQGQIPLHDRTAAFNVTGPWDREATRVRTRAHPMPSRRWRISSVRTTSRQMPPYREAVLPNEDLADIYAYLKSVPAAPDYKTIQILND